jgi:hypothetical protein
MACAPPRIFSTPFCSMSSASMCLMSTPTSLATPPCMSASFRLLYDSTSCTYLPTNATVTRRDGVRMRRTSSSQPVRRAARDQMLSSWLSLSSSPCSHRMSGSW